MDKFIRVTVDAVIKKGDEIVLIERKNPPYKCCYALPGGFVEYGESAEDAVVREAKEETNLDVKVEGLIGVYSEPGRDPRGHTVSIVFLCSVDGDSEISGGDDASSAEFFGINEVFGMNLAFDHKKIIKDMADKISAVSR